MELPAPYRSTTAGGATVIALPTAVEPVASAILAAGTLARYAAAREDAVPLTGRGTAYRIPVPGEAGGAAHAWLIRHYHRGGLVAGPVLGDRYLRLGEPRPVRELRVSHAARGRGVPTPEVVAAALYPAGMFYRADLVTGFVPDSLTLADLLFGHTSQQASERAAGCGAVGALVRRAHDAGLVHADLNLRNVLLQRTEAGFVPFLLDLDAARLVDAGSGVAEPARRRMLARFWRSAGKFEDATGRQVEPDERKAFEAAYTGAR